MMKKEEKIILYFIYSFCWYPPLEIYSLNK